MKIISKYLQLVCLGVAGLSIQSQTAQAAIAPLSDHWQFEAQTYLWAAGMNITPVSGDDLEISFSDILDKLDITIMGTVGARKGKFMIVTDIIYMDLENDDKASFQLGPGPGFDAKVDIEMKAFINNFGVGYTVYHSENWMLDLIGGSRFLYLDLELDADIARRGLKVDATERFWNGVVGLKSQIALTEKLNLDSYADIGTGDNDLTWQAQLGLHYQMGDWGLLAGYRYLVWEFDKNDDLGDALEKLEIKGPYLGARYAF